MRAFTIECVTLNGMGPIGEIEACGGIFMVRRAVFDEAGGFDADIIAAEDDEFCIRVRKTGARIVRIDHDMCFHDANITTFQQWWRRAFRAGNAFAQVGDMHKGYFVASRRRALLWGLVLPIVAVFSAFFSNGSRVAAFIAIPGVIFLEIARTSSKAERQRNTQRFIHFS